jgi:hypothetical protein
MEHTIREDVEIRNLGVSFHIFGQQFHSPKIRTESDGFIER